MQVVKGCYKMGILKSIDNHYNYHYSSIIFTHFILRTGSQRSEEPIIGIIGRKQGTHREKQPFTFTLNYCLTFINLVYYLVFELWFMGAAEAYPGSPNFCVCALVHLYLHLVF